MTAKGSTAFNVESVDFSRLCTEVTSSQASQHSIFELNGKCNYSIQQKKIVVGSKIIKHLIKMLFHQVGGSSTSEPQCRKAWTP